MGLKDLELWKKVRGARTRWEKVCLPPNLPAVDMSILGNGYIDSKEALSPPPGRPGQSINSTKRDRESSGSSAGHSRSKVCRKEDDI